MGGAEVEAEVMMRGWGEASTGLVVLTAAGEAEEDEEGKERPEQWVWWVLSRRLRLRLRFSLCRLLCRTLSVNVTRLLRLLLR